MSSTSTSTTTTTPTFLQCKVYLKPTDQVRRIQIDANCSLADFIHVAHQLYASNPLLAQQQQRTQPTVTISVTYMDEESDWITVTTDPEWRDALQRQVQLLKSQSSLLFKVQCTQIALPTRPQQQSQSQPQQQQQQQQQQHSVPTANAVGETLCSTACSLIDQVKRGHHQHVQPLVEQARDKTKDKVKKIQNWINESEDLHSIKQTFRDVLDTVVDEGSTTAALLISQLYKDIETIATVTGATTSAASASSSTWYANNDDEGDDEIVQQERQEEAQEEPREEQEQEQQHQEEEEEEAEQQEQQQQAEVNVAPEDDFVFVDNEHLPEQQAQEEQQVVVEQEEEEQQQPVEEPTPVEAEPEPMPVIEQQQPEEEEEEEQVVEQEQEQQQEVQVVPLEEPEAIPAPVQEQPQPQPQQPVDPRYQQYADKLTSLREMGFNDIDTNLNLLIKHKGDLTQVVTELLSL